MSEMEFICDELCRHPRECQDQQELDEICERCPLAEKQGGAEMDIKMERVLSANFADEEPEKEMEEKKDLPHRILGMIFEEKPEGISVGEIESILNETRILAKSIQMVLNAGN